MLGCKFWGIQTVSDCHLRGNPFFFQEGLACDSWSHAGILLVSCGWKSYPFMQVGFGKDAAALLVAAVGQSPASQGVDFSADT